MSPAVEVWSLSHWPPGKSWGRLYPTPWNWHAFANTSANRNINTSRLDYQWFLLGFLWTQDFGTQLLFCEPAQTTRRGHAVYKCWSITWQMLERVNFQKILIQLSSLRSFLRQAIPAVSYPNSWLTHSWGNSSLIPLSFGVIFMHLEITGKAAGRACGNIYCGSFVYRNLLIRKWIAKVTGSGDLSMKSLFPVQLIQMKIHSSISDLC